jgi:hypothetical protein
MPTQTRLKYENEKTDIIIEEDHALVGPVVVAEDTRRICI